LAGPVSRALDKTLVLPNARAQIAEFVAALPATAPKSTLATGKELMGRLHAAAGDSATAEKEFREALAIDPSLKPSLLALTKIEVARGDEKTALTHYLQLASAGGLKAEDDATFRALYKKMRGSDKNIEADIDRAFRTSYPNPVTPEVWKGSPFRTARIPLLELFTGSACGPCVAADYALDAVMERYAPKDIAVLAYHVHIPGPDPMTTAASAARKEYYKDYVLGVPTFIADGAMVRLGGGGREQAGVTYGAYAPFIDGLLTTPAEAMLALKTTESKGKMTVTTTIGNVAPGFKNLKLHVVIAEEELTFSGENGIAYFSPDGGTLVCRWTKHPGGCGGIGVAARGPGKLDGLLERRDPRIRDGRSVRHLEREGRVGGARPLVLPRPRDPQGARPSPPDLHHRLRCGRVVQECHRSPGRSAGDGDLQHDGWRLADSARDRGV